jgi:hypothetical protein
MAIFKKILFLSLLVGAVLLHIACFAEADIKVVIDDKALVTDVSPTIIDGRTLVPLRAIFEALGATVEWNAETVTVTAKKDNTIIILKVNDKYPLVNGKQQELDVPATVINDRTMVPVRFIANSLGTYVRWDGELATVSITTPKVITFNDKNFEKVVREKTGISTGDIKNVDVMGIVSLEASNAGIENIGGIENFISLTHLDLSKNNIKTIEPLQYLNKLVELNLSGNKISYIYYLKDLVFLNKLDLSSNKIKDVNILSNINGLKELSIQFNPLSSLSALEKYNENTKIYLIDNKYPVSILDKDSLQEYEKVIKKASEITGKIIKSNMTDLEKELAIHDYLILNTKYDSVSLVNLRSSDNCHSAYGALVQGTAVCDGYAKAMEIMLNMVGVECITVTGFSYSYESRPIGHAWNIVNIDGDYYHMDVTSDDWDGDVMELNHNFFNISDKQIASSHNWDRFSYPKCEKDNKDFDSLKNLLRTTIYAEDGIYKVASSNLYKIDPKTSKAVKLIDDKMSEIQILDDWIYYINESDQQRVYKIKKDGTEKTKIADQTAMHIVVNENSIFYISKEDNKLYEASTKTNSISEKIISSSDFTTNIFEIDGWLYCRVFSWYLGGGFERIKSSSTIERDSIVNDTPGGFKEISSGDGMRISFGFGAYERVSDGYLYYTSTNNNNTLYRLKLDGSMKEKICDDSIDSLHFEVVGEYIYYQNSQDGNKTYRVNVDGKQRICLQ